MAQEEHANTVALLVAAPTQQHFALPRATRNPVDVSQLKKLSPPPRALLNYARACLD
jgi:hypothetical protein